MTNTQVFTEEVKVHSNVKDQETNFKYHQSTQQCERIRK